MARLRKGLFEERLSDKPADRWSVCSGWVAAIMTRDAANANCYAVSGFGGGRAVQPAVLVSPRTLGSASGRSGSR